MHSLQPILPFSARGETCALLGAAIVLLASLSGCGREEATREPGGEDPGRLIEAPSGFPDLFAEYHAYIRTTDGEKGPGYPQNYQIEELSRARRAAKGPGAPLPWIEHGPGNVGGRTRAIVVDPEDPQHDTWYAASVSGGIWKTTTEGRSWANITPDIPNLAFSTLVQAASDPNVLYAGSGEGFFNGDAVSGAGIFKSSDRGNTWIQLPSTADDSDFRFVNRLVVSPSDPDLVLAATRAGIFRSSDGGASWIQSYITISTSGVFQVVADPSNFDRLYATENGSGVLRSNDAGIKWGSASVGLAGLGDGALNSGARVEIAVAPSEPTRLYAAIEVDNDSDVETDDTDQLFMSRNGGDLWFPIHPIQGGSDPDWMALAGANQGWYDNALAVHPFDPSVVFLGGINVWRATMSGSEDRSILTSFEKFGTEVFMDFINFGASHFGGTLSWGLAEEGAIVSESDFVSVEVRFGPGRSQMAHRFTPPDGPGIAFSTYPYADYVEVPFEVWDVSNNRQLMVSFRDRLNDGQFDLIRFNPANIGREYVLIHAYPYASSSPNLLVARDGGVVNNLLYFYWPMLSDDAEWNPGALPLSSIRINHTAEPVPLRTMFRIGSGLAVHVDQHALVPIAVDAASGTIELLSGNDGGVYLSLAGGSSWSNRNSGYNTSQFYGVDKAPSSLRFLGGTQDNGSWRSPDNPVSTTSWTRVFGADGFDPVWHQEDRQKMIVSYQFNGLRRSLDGGVSWGDAVVGLTDTGSADRAQFITSLDRAPDDPDLLFTIGSSGVWKSTDFGGSWSLRPIPEDRWGFSGSGRVRVSLASSNIVWAGYEMDPLADDPSDPLGQLHVSTDRGETFEPVPTPVQLSPGHLSGIATHPENDSTVFALFSAFGHAKVLRSNDLGQAWEDISGFAGNPGPGSSNGFPDVAVYDLLVLPFRTDEIWVGTEIGLFVSEDDGATWARADSGLPAASIWRIRLVEDQIILATHGRGIWSVAVSAVVALATDNEAEIPETATLEQNFPNPFNPSTTISYSLPNREHVTITVFDLTGRVVERLIDAVRQPGAHRVVWDARNIASGVYFYRLEAGAVVRTRTMILVN